MSSIDQHTYHKETLLFSSRYNNRYFHATPRPSGQFRTDTPRPSGQFRTDILNSSVSIKRHTCTGEAGLPKRHHTLWLGQLARLINQHVSEVFPVEALHVQHPGTRCRCNHHPLVGPHLHLITIATVGKNHLWDAFLQPLYENLLVRFL